MATPNSKLLQLRRQQLEIARHQAALAYELPHLYGKKFYPWARKFYDSENRVNLLCAANQISKSSTAIRRCIADATDPERWIKFWGEGFKPQQFWYFYPDSLTLQREWHTKWAEWMPRGKAKEDKLTGWKAVLDKNTPKYIAFNSGVKVFFQFYTKKVANVQSSTVHEIFVDEELPMEFYDELMFRLTTTRGIFNAVFTPTLNQPFWRKAMETNETLESAFKQTISMYDCLTYEDGTPGHFTIDQIKMIKEKCKSDTEVQRRVYGRFVTEQGRTYYSFDVERHHQKPIDTTSYNCHASVDYGSGGSGGGHPAAIIFIAVSPDYKSGRVIKCWRGDGIETTAGDVFNKYQEMAAEIKIPIVMKIYDPASKDFGTIATRNSVGFIKADKSRELGEDIVNTLFRNDMLIVDETEDGESDKLCTELMHMMKDNRAVANKRGDDLADALRYGCALINWDWSVVEEKARERLGKIIAPVKVKTELDYLADQIAERRSYMVGDNKEPDEWQEMSDEMEYWNEQYG